MTDVGHDDETKERFHTYLQQARDAMVWKLEGLSEYDVRRPVTPTGTNLLGLVKHLTIVEAWYFGRAFDRPFGEPLDWWDDDAEPDVDSWVTPDETRADVVERYRRATGHADASIAALPLDSVGHVPWWPTAPTLLGMLVHVLAETARHAGHADIVREQIDGAAGVRADNDNLPDRDERAWADHRARVEAAARAAAPEPVRPLGTAAPAAG